MVKILHEPTLPQEVEGIQYQNDIVKSQIIIKQCLKQHFSSDLKGTITIIPSDNGGKVTLHVQIKSEQDNLNVARKLGTLNVVAKIQHFSKWIVPYNYTVENNAWVG